MEEKRQLAPLAIEACLFYIKNHMKKTSRYREGEHCYVLEPKLMARIIKHGGNMKAAVQETETRFFYHLLRWAVSEHKFKSAYSNARFQCEVVKTNDPYRVRVQASGVLTFGGEGKGVTVLCL